jgi:two-component system phosphate regulon sensor histidine kinase PhoR
LLKLNKDGHYFGVYFPNRTTSIWVPKETGGITWAYPAMVTLIMFAFFTYSLWVILRQKRLGEMKNDFIGNMTHELKTPISTIALSSEVLLDPAIVNEPERLSSYAGIIHAENERLRQQVERVLQLSTLENGGPDLQRGAVDMHALVNEVRNSFAVLLEERGGTAELDLRAEAHIVKGDRIHLGNALFNLMDNAMKYSRDAPRIVISSESGPKRMRITVRDRGIGIRREDLANIFERFFRVHTGNVHDVKGFGLGLHYVAEIVRAHRGKVHVESTWGEGSAFTLELPLMMDRNDNRTDR